MLANIGSGVMLAAGARRVSLRFTYSVPQAVGLVLLWNLVLVAKEFAGAGADPRFQAWGLVGQAVEAACVVAAAYVIALVEAEKEAFLRLVVLLSSVVFLPLAVAYVFQYALYLGLAAGATIEAQYLLWMAFAVWLTLSCYRAVRLEFRRGILESGFLAVVAVLGYLAPSLWFPTPPVWRPDALPAVKPILSTMPAPDIAVPRPRPGV
jgi:hypothetical protein